MGGVKAFILKITVAVNNVIHSVHKKFQHVNIRKTYFFLFNLYSDKLLTLYMYHEMHISLFG